MKCLCLVSGGMDSCVTAAIAARETDEQVFLHVTYGQRTAARELKAFQDIADHYGVEDRVVVDMGHIAMFGGSAILSGSREDPRNLEDPEDGIPRTYVPFRNGAILAMAVGLAEARGASRLYIGAVEEDSSGYPDCRRPFYDAFEKAVDLGTRPGTRITIHTPVILKSKAEIVQKGVELKAPLHLTWSCYVQEEEACGQCDSCRLRLRGFSLAGAKDPVPYA